MRPALFASVLVLAGCSEPEPPPSLHADPTLGAQVADADGFDGVSPRFTGFVEGAQVRYWIIAGGTNLAMPVYRLCRPENDDDCAPIDHPPIVDLIPGDAGYSAYGQVHWVHMPEGWSGQLTSFAEVDQAIGDMSLEPPERSTLLWHCPIAAPDAELAVGDGISANPEGVVYVRSMSARCFDFSTSRESRLLSNAELFVRHVYVLRRDGEAAPISESAQMVDLTGDGDMVDSNNVFGVGLTDDFYTPWWRVVMVTVPSSFLSIDTAGDDSVSDYRDARDMFDVAPDYTITPIAGQIVDHTLTDMLINCPLQSADGVL